jgi:aminopeptidase N
MHLPRAIGFAPLLLLAAWVAGCTATPAQDSGGPLLPEQAAYDVTHYDLAVAVDPAQRRIEGEVTVHAVVEARLEHLVLNLDRRLAVTKAWPAGTPANARPVERRNDDNQVWIGLDQPRARGDTVRVSLAYEGAPRAAPGAPWDGGLSWETTPNGAPWIATSCQTEGADLWWPVKDHPSDEPDSMDLAFTVPDSLIAASNGVLRGVERDSDSTRTYRWHVSVPINPYNVSLNAAPYVALDTTYASTSGGAVPVSAYVLPSDSARAAKALPGFLRQLRFLEQTLGPFPPRADKYGLAQTPFLGMEHQSLIAYGHDFTTGGVGYEAPFDALHFHELAHEWYGNLLTVRDWKDFWLHEGTATYLEALYTEHLQGDRAYHERIDYFRGAMSGGRPLARRTPTSAEAIYHRDVYYRGAMVLHTLRYVMGEAALRTLLRQFANPNGAETEQSGRFRHVTTTHFVRLAEEVSGRSLEAFFEVYLYRGALPVLETTRAEGQLRLRWTNTGDLPFAVPVPVRVDGHTRRVSMRGGTGTVAVPDEAAVEVDPAGWILRAEGSR